MHHAVLARQQLDKHAEVHHADDLARVNLADFDILGNAFDDAARLRGGSLVRRRDIHAAVVVDVDLHARLVDDLVDHLSARSNNLADLIRVDGKADDLRRVSAQVLARLRQHLEHLAEDEQAAVQRLRQRLTQNRLVNALDLDIHLDGGDAVHRARNLEIHVAEEVLQTLDIGQHGHLVAVRILNQTHGHARNRRLDRHTRIHQRQRRAADGGLRRGAVGGEHLAHHADGIRELVHRRDHRLERALGQRAMADFAAAGALEAARLAGGIRRHVVVVHVALAGLRAETLDHLRLAHGRERRDREHLRLAAGKHAGAMHARQNAGFAPNRANLGQAAAVRAHSLLQNLGAHDFLVEVIQRVVHLVQAAFEALGVELVRLLLHLILARAALVAVKRLKRPRAAVEEVRANGGLHILARLCNREHALFLADFSHNLLLEGDQLLDLLVAGENRAEHVRLADLLRARLDHQHGLVRAGNRQAQLGNRALLLIRVDDDFAVHQTDGNAADRARPRDIADRNRGGSADHRGNIRRHVLLNGKHRRHNLHVVAHALVEQRAQRAVDQAGGQRRLFGRTTLALDETAGDLAHGIHLLFKVNAQREKVLTLARRVARRRVDHDHRVAQSNDHRSVSLTAVLAKFHNQRAPRQLCGIRLDHRVESPFKIPACQHFFSDANPRRLIYKTDFSIRFRFIKNEKGRRLGRQKLSPKRRSSGTKPFS